MISNIRWSNITSVRKLFSDLLINSGADHILHFTFLKKKRKRLIEYLNLYLGYSKFVLITDVIRNLIRLNSEIKYQYVSWYLGIQNHGCWNRGNSFNIDLRYNRVIFSKWQVFMHYLHRLKAIKTDFQDNLHICIIWGIFKNTNGSSSFKKFVFSWSVLGLPYWYLLSM